MQVREIMTRSAETVSPGYAIGDAAKRMDDLNIGALPVCDGERLVGIITDRDVTVRATAAGKGPEDCRVGDVMTAEVDWCLEDDFVEQAAAKMKARQIRRLPVLNGERKLVGMLSLGDLATSDGDGRRNAADALERISEPSEPDRKAAR